MDEEAALLQQVVEALERINVPYMIGGSVALGVWATPPMTHLPDPIFTRPHSRPAVPMSIRNRSLVLCTILLGHAVAFYV